MPPVALTMLYYRNQTRDKALISSVNRLARAKKTPTMSWAARCAPSRWLTAARSRCAKRACAARAAPSCCGTG
ncbi:hypothetical protein LP419_18535 [Massilia sp. H-1]|nr:hypothetical protein LP419_18535 [Massilia sp. H-1]